MRTNKEMVVMYMQDMTIKKGEDFKGFTTQELSADLNIQRTNLSAILNDCVKQGILEKSKQRPVPVSYTHLDVYKRQLLYLAYTSFHFYCMYDRFSCRAPTGKPAFKQWNC